MADNGIAPEEAPILCETCLGSNPFVRMVSEGLSAAPVLPHTFADWFVLWYRIENDSARHVKFAIDHSPFIGGSLRLMPGTRRRKCAKRAQS